MSQPNQRRFRLTASVAVSHFKHRCDRRFRWGVVARGDRGKPGIGWNVPAYERAHSRPGIALLMTAGDEFELERLHALEASLATASPVPGVEARVHHAGTHTERGRERVAPLPLADTLDLLRQPLPPRFIAQVEINLAPYPTMEACFLRRFGLDPDMIELGVSRPDLVEILPPDANHMLSRLRVWDFKGSEEPRHEHFIQVAFYVLLLQAVIEKAGLANFGLDTEIGVIEARNGRNEFDLAPYLLALSDFLQNRVPTLLATPAADAHFHVHEGCMLCEHMDECRTRANASFDLSRIPYITSESKRHLLTAGFRSHPDLAALNATSDQQTIEQLRQLSHDLSTNVARYIAAAQALQDGTPRVLDKRSFQMPAYENIRVVLCAEQDAVTGTCFALGIKTYEGWDTANNRPLGQEHVFIARNKGDEVSILLPFLRTLNRFLDRVDTANETVRSQPIDADPRVVAAEQAWDDAKASCASFRADHAEALKSKKRDPHTAALRAERDALEAAAKAAGKVVKEVRGTVAWEQRRAQKKLHFYIYDTLDVLALRGLFERQLLAAYPPALLVELSQLIRLFPPESVLPDAETFRTIPFTIIVQMLRAMVALPIAYGYDLRTVSELYQPAKGGFQFRTPYGFSWEHSNQVAFERIHDVWNNETFSHKQRTYKPLEILPEIEKAVLAKLRATDSVIRRLKEDLKERLLLKKEPFRLFKASDPIQVQKLEALRIFTTLEVSYDELETKRTHTLPVADRVAGFICIHGLQALATELDAEGTLWLSFDRSASDTKFEAGNYNLVLTPADDPTVLLSEIDGDLFASTSNRGRFAPYKVTLVEYNTQISPPRVRLKPANPPQFLKWFDPARTFVLDRLFVDYNSHKVFDVLGRVATAGQPAAHIQALLAGATIPGWKPFVSDVGALETDLRTLLAAAGKDPNLLLNGGQWRAWRGVLNEPLTLVWGPPGTGKTHTIAHMLIGYVLAARRQGQPIRVLVTAFTHLAIHNVLRKLVELTGRYGLSAGDLQIGKLQRNASTEPDEDIPPGVLPIDTDGFTNTLENAIPCQVVGATVWAVHRAMKEAGDVVQPWFDVVLVDEASQMKLPDALIAFASSKPTANFILAGDDRQLPPIIHGAYPEQHQPLLSSVFAFVRDCITQQQLTTPDLERRILFQLEENFRMNKPLTVYPSDRLYQGRFVATKPDIRIVTEVPLAAESDDLIEFLLHPERPVMLVRYRPPRSFTARNPLEAELAAQLVATLSTLLIDQEHNAVYTPHQFCAEGVAVLAPHRAQNSTIRQLLRGYGFGTETQPMPLVDTVDKLQGQERDVVVMSYGVADSEYAEGEAEFLLSSNRFNVAATRARHKLIVICADTVLDLVPAEQQVLYDAMMLKEFRRYCDSGQRDFRWAGGDGQTVSFQVQWKEFER